jgi:hypothetical protein
LGTLEGDGHTGHGLNAGDLQAMLPTLRRRWLANPSRLVLTVAITVVISLWIRGQILANSSIPSSLRQQVEQHYAQCVNVSGSSFRGDMNPERACREVRVEAVGEGSVRPQDQAAGVSKAYCFRVNLRSPYWITPSKTQFEEIGWTEMTHSKVALLQDGVWVIFPDREESDHNRWIEYACQEDY